jgi:prepilin-type N-terminal cleavage/methylation domain-containing protein
MLKCFKNSQGGGKMKINKNNQGFTLIELLLVVGIVGIILAVVVPMGLRANIDAKYGVVRQNCSELASFASQWVEKSIQAQDEQRSTATVKDYYASLAGAPEAPNTAGSVLDGQWIAIQTGANNWNLGESGTVETRSTTQINGRFMNNQDDQAPEDCVEDVIPPDKSIRNPFTQVSVFRAPNDPETQGGPITGAVALGGAAEDAGEAGGNPWIYYAFAFQGTDSTTAQLIGDDTTFHAGMGLDTIPKLRNGVFLGRFR